MNLSERGCQFARVHQPSVETESSWNSDPNRKLHQLRNRKANKISLSAASPFVTPKNYECQTRKIPGRPRVTDRRYRV
jgi:hypothetical protein